MIRVLIVEDEPPTLRRIAAMVEQLDPTFSVVGTALNGQMALHVLGHTPCDVVLTDIRMPVMDGLQLMDQLRELYPELIIVALSGHSDFSYVSHAMRARSLDYLLKPVSAESLRELLARIRAQHMADSRVRLRRDLSMRLNKSAEGELTAQPSEDPIGLCLLCAGSFPFGDDAEMYPAADCWSGRSLERLAEEIAPGYAAFTWAFMGNTPVERILIFQTQSEDIDSWVRCLHEALLDSAGIPVSCAYFQSPVTLSDTGKSFARLRKALREHMRIGRSLLLPLDPAENVAETPQPFHDPAALDALIAILSGGQGVANGREKKELLARMEREQWTQQRVMALFAGAASALEHSEQESLRELARHLKTVLPDQICMSLSWAELEQSIDSLTELAPDPAPDAKAGQDAVIDAIERYLREHYAEHITNQTLAASFGYVPSYISMLFRRKYTLSPSEYLTQVRLNQAKRLLQAQPDLLIREIAEAVGFKSQHHFSRIFKKNEGIWPTGYQSWQEDEP